MAGILVLYLGGLTQLAVLSGSVAWAAVAGVLPFVAADAVKALVAAALTAQRRRTSTV
jgi:biotin transporter BioY